MFRRLVRILAAATPVLGVIVAAGSVAAVAAPRTATTLWVAPAQGGRGEATGCATAAYHSIGKALASARSGDTVEVCAGTYDASTTVHTSLPGIPEITTAAHVPSGVRLLGRPGAVIDAKGLDNGITVFRAVGVTVSGLRVSGAVGEGVLVLLSSRVTIAHDVVTGNDRGSSQSQWAECEAAGKVPDDCGEGIHLLSAKDSGVIDDTSEFNAGGILLSDDFGPTAHDVVSGNLVEDNESDCGITVVGHSGSAVSGDGKPQPGKAGTYDNTISGNVVVSNGTRGDGGGVLLASGAPGGGSYDNTVSGNEIVGNGLSGVTIHQHFPLSDLSGDVVSGNWIGTNDIDGDPGTGDSATTGVLLDNGGTHRPISVRITGNTIAWDTDGIYDDTGGGLTQSHNTFLHVRIDVQR